MNVQIYVVKRRKTTLEMNRKLVMIPGPTPVVRSIQSEMGRETASFKDPDFVKDFKQVNTDLKTLWQTDGEVFVVAGSGTLSMEMAVSNILKEGDPVLVLSHGFFGDRMIELCSRKGFAMDTLSSKWGEIVPLKEIEAKLSSKHYKAVIVSHVDTSTGVKAPVAELGKLLEAYEDTLFVVDGVCSSSGEPEYMDTMGIDVLFTASQKAFGVPPGLSIVWASSKALQRRKSLGEIREYYVDFEKWLPIMQDPSKYFGTPPVNLIWALKESLRMIKAEGLEARYERHKKVGQSIQAALESLGFTLLANENVRASTLSNALYPSGVEDEAFRGALGKEGIVVAGGLGDYAGKMFRLGHMGNVDVNELVYTISAIERALVKVGYEVELGKGVGVFLEAFQA